MADEEAHNIPLSKMIQSLRVELQDAVSAAAGEWMRFDVDQVELELQIALKRSGKAKAGIEFWVVSLGAEGQIESATTHVFKISLKPHLVTGGSVKVGDTGNKASE